MNELYVETSNSAQGNSLVSVQTLAFQSAADKVPSQHFLFQFQDKEKECSNHLKFTHPLKVSCTSIISFDISRQTRTFYSFRIY